MPHTRARSLALFLLLAFGFAAPSDAQNALGTSTSGTQSPVSINICEPIFDKNHSNPFASPSPQEAIAAFLTPKTSSGMHIQFTNESQKAADLVNFDVDSNGNHFVIRDVGTFSPGVSIDHTYRNGNGQAFVLPAFIAPHVTCSVASVRFVDRTVWPPAPGTAAGSRPTMGTALSANPATVVLSPGAESALLMISSSARVAGFNESDDCAGIASVFVSATSQTSAVYSVKPLAAGSCTAKITDETGRTIAVPIAVQ
ncbi:MAG: hypothetical protein ACREM2_03665 [Vulcanimicrobiaceae bacterium]